MRLRDAGIDRRRRSLPRESQAAGNPSNGAALTAPESVARRPARPPRRTRRGPRTRGAVDVGVDRQRVAHLARRRAHRSALRGLARQVPHRLLDGAEKAVADTVRPARASHPALPIPSTSSGERREPTRRASRSSRSHRRHVGSRRVREAERVGRFAETRQAGVRPEPDNSQTVRSRGCGMSCGTGVTEQPRAHLEVRGRGSKERTAVKNDDPTAELRPPP